MDFASQLHAQAQTLRHRKAVGNSFLAPHPRFPLTKVRDSGRTWILGAVSFLAGATNLLDAAMCESVD